MDFYPFGLQMGSHDGTSRREYTGHERDEETGLDYMMARYKQTCSPRFTSPDPIFDTSLTAPTTWNRYGYVHGDPIGSWDPWGLSDYKEPPEAVDIGLVDYLNVTAPAYGTGAYSVFLLGQVLAMHAQWAPGGGPGIGPRGGTGLSPSSTRPTKCGLIVVFDISDGTLSVSPGTDRSYALRATSGTDDCINNSACVGRQNEGPIPPGQYRGYSRELSDPNWLKTIGRNLTGDWGDWRMPLHPFGSQNMFGRDGFFMHGGKYLGSAGCIDCGGGWFGNEETDRLKGDLAEAIIVCVEVKE